MDSAYIKVSKEDESSLPIFFSDLNDEAKGRVLRFYELDREEDGNFEEAPLCVLTTNYDGEY